MRELNKGHNHNNLSAKFWTEKLTLKFSCIYVFRFLACSSTFQMIEFLFNTFMFNIHNIQITPLQLNVLKHITLSAGNSYYNQWSHVDFVIKVTKISEFQILIIQIPVGSSKFSPIAKKLGIVLQSILLILYNFYGSVTEKLLQNHDYLLDNAQNLNQFFLVTPVMLPKNVITDREVVLELCCKQTNLQRSKFPNKPTQWVIYFAKVLQSNKYIS